MAFSPKRASQPFRAAFRLSPTSQHKRREFDKEIVAPRLEFLKRGLRFAFRAHLSLDVLGSDARNGLRSDSRLVASEDPRLRLQQIIAGNTNSC
jgi:hypothetical protein